MDFPQVDGKFADGPAGEGLSEPGRAGGGRLDDEVLVVRTEQAGTASRLLRVQTGQADLVEPVDRVADGVLVGLHQLGDHRHPVPAGRGQQHHRPPVAHRTGTAPAHDLLQLLPILVGQPAHTDRLRHHNPQQSDQRTPPHIQPLRPPTRRTFPVRALEADQDPSTWLLPLADVRCFHAADWVATKLCWGLTVDQAETEALTALVESWG